MRFKLVAVTMSLFCLLSASALSAAQITLAWDPNNPNEQVSKYTVYQKIGSTYNKIKDVQASACTATECRTTLDGVTPGVYTYVVTASNAWGESGYSNEVTTPPAVSAPRNVIITITITITTP